MTTVPNVVGKPIVAAKVALMDRGLALGRIDTVTSPYPEGHVVRQDPAAGSQMAKTAEVRLTVSGGQP